MIRNRLLVCLATLAVAASEPDFSASLNRSEAIEPSPDFRKTEMFDLWSRSAGLTSDGRCLGIVPSASGRQLAEVDLERCAYVKPNENGFPSVPCRPGQEEHGGGWIVTCRNLPDGHFELVAEAAKSTGVEARVELMTGGGEALHFGIFGLHDRQLIRVLSINPDGSGTNAEYVWSADAAARYFSQRARSTPRS